MRLTISCGRPRSHFDHQRLQPADGGRSAAKNIMTLDNRFIRDEFPRSNAYNPDWVVANASGGANSLWLVEWLHSAAWWSRHWERSGIVDIELADSMPDGWQRWLEWHNTIAPDNLVEIAAVQSDHGEYLGYNRVIGRRRPNVTLAEPILSVPSNYVEKQLLRDGL